MKFLFDRDSMIKEIAIAQEVIANKSPLSILSNIFLAAENNTLTIKASDAIISYVTRIPVEIIEEGSTTIYCDKFMSILSSSPSGEIEFEQKDILVTIKPAAKKIKFQLKSIASQKFPEIKIPEDEVFFEVPSKELKEMIKQTSFAASEDEKRFFMMGVFFEKKEDALNMVATDGRRLSSISKNLGLGLPDVQNAIIPIKILNCIVKNAPSEGNISIAVVDNMIFFKFGNYEFSSLLREGQFPDYKRVIPDHQTSNFQVNKHDLEDALKRISIMVDKKVSRILFRVAPGVLTLISPESDLGNADEDIPCQYDGDEVTIAFNYKYVEEPLKLTDSERISFDFTESMKAVTMRNEPASDYFHIIMPMNLL